MLILNKFLFMRKLETYDQLEAGNLSKALKLQRTIFFVLFWVLHKKILNGKLYFLCSGGSVLLCILVVCLEILTALQNTLLY